METFEELLDNLWLFDSEVFAHDNLFVFISYRTKERKVFCNATPDDIVSFLDIYHPILMGYNAKSYDKYILKAIMCGYSPEEVKTINDYIINGGNGWEYQFDDSNYFEMPPIWDLMLEINPRKSLKELEGNLRLNITETTIPFDLPTKWNKQQYEEVLYYCTCDVEALFPIFENLMTGYKSKYIICKFGNIEPRYGLSLTNANLTATLLGAERQEHNDYFLYEFPSVVDKSKIPKAFLDYINECREHNDPNYEIEAPTLELKDITFQVGLGGGHGFLRNGIMEYDRGDGLGCK